MELVKLIADLEPVPRTDVKVLFAARFDTNFDEATIEYVSKKFPVYRMKCQKQYTGWPSGPNSMVGESYSWCVDEFKKVTFTDDCVLLVEADACPLHKDWLNMLLAEWEECKRNGKQVLGHWLLRGAPNIEHINGNCIVGINFWKTCPAMLAPDPRVAWDCGLHSIILPHAWASKLIWSDYKLGTPQNPWKGCDHLFAEKFYMRQFNQFKSGEKIKPVWFHGTKGPEGLICARQRLLG